MRVSVVINTQAGSANEARIRRRIHEALFRCDLEMISGVGLDETFQFIDREMDLGSDALVICGGDGTINRCLQPIMDRREHGRYISPLCIVASGTANDLGSELRLDRRIDRAAREIFEGEARLVDVLKVTAEGTKSYFLTNGGFGISEMAARGFNQLRDGLRRVGDSRDQSAWARAGAILSLEALQQLKAHIYELTFLKSLVEWRQKGWKLEITLDDRRTIVTEAPIILVNNQPRIGGKFVPAPFTFNNDGTFGLLIITETNRLKILSLIQRIKDGREPGDGFLYVEVRKMRVKVLDETRPLSFFGDGETLVKDAHACEIECLNPGVQIFSHRGQA